MRVFQSAEIEVFLSLPKQRLAKFVESPGYGIAPTGRHTSGKGSPRLYTLDDVLKIGLCWWLFRAGFRSQVIGRVLRDRVVSKALKDSEGWNPRTAKRGYLVIQRGLSSTAHVEHKVTVSSTEEIVSALKASDRHGFQILPLGSLLRGLWEQLHAPQEVKELPKGERERNE